MILEVGNSEIPEKYPQLSNMEGRQASAVGEYREADLPGPASAKSFRDLLDIFGTIF